MPIRNQVTIDFFVDSFDSKGEDLLSKINWLKALGFNAAHDVEPIEAAIRFLFKISPLSRFRSSHAEELRKLLKFV